MAIEDERGRSTDEFVGLIPKHPLRGGVDRGNGESGVGYDDRSGRVVDQRLPEDARAARLLLGAFALGDVSGGDRNSIVKLDNLDLDPFRVNAVETVGGKLADVRLAGLGDPLCTHRSGPGCGFAA